MAAPVIISASVDRPTYATGDRVTLTVTYSDADTRRIRISVQATDASGNKSAVSTVNALIDPTTLTVTDDGGHAWAKVSDTGSVAVFTTTF